MRKILIAGAGSYIGTSFEKYISQHGGEYKIDTIDMIDGSWREKSFCGYDAVYIVAGIAHIKETPGNAHLYYKVNRDLAVETAEKAKAEGVGQVIYLSSMSVYGQSLGVITESSEPSPNSNYGKSKFEAEKLLFRLMDDKFKVAILRPPVVYGKGCKGSYQVLSKWAKRAPVFPKFKNIRSMLFVDNLSIFVKRLIDTRAYGCFCPQNSEYICTSDMIREIAAASGHKIWFTPILNPIVKIGLYFRFNIFSKAFGNLIYTNSNDTIDEVDFRASIIQSEEGVFR